MSGREKYFDAAMDVAIAAEQYFAATASMKKHFHQLLKERVKVFTLEKKAYFK